MLSIKNKNAEVKNMNPRIENHGEDRVVVVDIKVEVPMPASVLKEIDGDTKLDEGLWDENGKPVGLLDRNIKLGFKAEEAEVEIDSLTLTCDIKKPKIRLLPNKKLAMILSLQAKIDNEDDWTGLFPLLEEPDVSLTINSAQLTLDLGEEDQAQDGEPGDDGEEEGEKEAA